MTKSFQNYDVVMAYPAERIRLFDSMIPLGIASMISMLQKNGYTVRYVDFNHYRGNFESDLKKWSPKIVGIGGTTPTRFESFKIAKAAKRVLPNIPTIFGGVHASFTPVDTLRHVPEIDYVFKGEGEYGFLGICDQFVGNRNIDIRRLPGFCYRESGKIIQNPIARIDNLDELPIPVREFEDINYSIKMDYCDLAADFLVTSRGCPARCIFCSASAMFPGGVRFRSIDLIETELDDVLSRRKNIKALKLFDSTFTASREHVLNFCKMIKPYHLLWECEVRADTVDYVLLKEMKNAGCYYIDMGLETSNDRFLKRIGKNITLRSVEKVLDWCTKLDIRTKLFMIFGLLDQTLNDCREDVSFLKCNKHGIDLFATTFGLRVYPGTNLEKKLISKGIMPPHFSWARFKPSKKNWLLLEFGNTFILDQKRITFYHLIYLIFLLMKQRTILSDKLILKLIKENIKNIFSMLSSSLKKRISILTF